MAQSCTILRAQSRRLLNKACHDCRDLVSSIELGAGVGAYRFGKGDSDTREVGVPGEVACDVIRISYTYISFYIFPFILLRSDQTRRTGAGRSRSRLIRAGWAGLADFRLYCLDLHGLPLGGKGDDVLGGDGALTSHPCFEVI